MRDFYIVEYNASVPENPNHRLASALATAVAEYEQYKTCIGKYYRLIGGRVEKLKQGTDEEVHAEYNHERAFHWGMFWRLVTLNMEDWLSTDAAIQKGNRT